MQVGNLGIKGVGEARAFFIGLPGGADVAAGAVGGQIKDVAVAAGGQDHRVGRVAFDFAGDEVPDHDAPGHPVDRHQLQHLPAGEHGDLALGDLAHHPLVTAEQQLLAGLPPGVKGPGDLGAAEGAVGQQPSVFPGEGQARGHAVVNDIIAYHRQAVDVALPGPEIAALDGVVKEPPDAVPVIGVVLGRVDAPLGRDAVGPPGAVLDAKSLDVVAQLRQGRGGRTPGQAGAHHDDLKFPLIRRVDQFQIEAVPVPLGCQRSPGNFAVELHCRTSYFNASMARGREPKPTATITAKMMLSRSIQGIYFG